MSPFRLWGIAPPVTSSFSPWEQSEFYTNYQATMGDKTGVFISESSIRKFTALVIDTSHDPAYNNPTAE